VGFHPHFLMAGIPTHYDDAEGNAKTIHSYVHLFSDHIKAAYQAGWQLITMDEGLIDDEWIAAKPKWEKHRGMPVSFVFVWQL